MAKDPSLDEMRDEAYRRQDNLASDIDELIDRVNPKNAVERWKNELVGSVKSFSEAGDGKSPSNGALAAAGGVIGLVVLTAGIAVAFALSGDDEEKARKQAAKEAEKAREDARKARAEFFDDIQSRARTAEKQVRGGIEKARKDAQKSGKKARKSAKKASKNTSSDIEKALKRARKAVAKATK